MSYVDGLLLKSISCFDKLGMSGKVTWFQHITVRPESRPGGTEGQTVGLGNNPLRSNPHCTSLTLRQVVFEPTLYILGERGSTPKGKVEKVYS